MLICVTNRKLCKDDYLQRISRIAQGQPHAILLREKDLNMWEYELLAYSIRRICSENSVNLIIHQNILIAEKLRIPHLHLSMPDLRQYQSEIKRFNQVGASVHSIDEAKEAQDLGATYLIAGHIFSTESKKGVPPRGLLFLRTVCDTVEIPVFAIGGITKDRVTDVINAGARGICIMSEAMTCLKPVELAKYYSFIV